MSICDLAGRLSLTTIPLCVFLQISFYDYWLWIMQTVFNKVVSWYWKYKLVAFFKQESTRTVIVMTTDMHFLFSQSLGLIWTEWNIASMKLYRIKDFWNIIQRLKFFICKLWHRESLWNWKLIMRNCAFLKHIPKVWNKMMQTTGWRNGLVPVRHQAITSTRAYLLAIWPFGLNLTQMKSKRKFLFKMYQ